MGGVTSSLKHFRAGQYSLNKGGPYRKFFPEVLKLSKGRFHADYGFHLAPIDATHSDEIPELISRHGVASFKSSCSTARTGCMAHRTHSASS
jgi:allantoinase